jgi:amino acid transporter
MRDEAKRIEKDKHRRRALIFNVVFTGLALVFIAFLLVMATHWPKTLVEEEGVRGTWSGDVETEWDTISIAHGLDLSGNTTMVWSVNRGPDNETVEEGVHTSSDDQLIIVDLGDTGGYTVHLDPEGRNDAKPYDVRVKEHYVSPVTVEVLYYTAAAVLAFVVGIIGLVFLFSDRRKFYEEYKLTWWVTGPLLGMSAIVVLVLPWL